MLAGESGVWAEDWHFELDTPYIPALQLPHAIIKRICYFLPTQGDQQRACLIHPIWAPAATDSLWQEPVFNTAAAFQGFYKAAHVFKRLALRVQALNIIHDPYSNNTDAVKLSTLPQHSLRESPLAKPEVILALVRLCENITALKIYGWQMKARHVEMLSATLHGLKHLTVIGDTGEMLTLTSSFRNLVTKLCSLKLDGVLNTNARFMDLLDRKCADLHTLQLSVQELGPEGFEILNDCKLPLRDLTLTDCAPLDDSHVAYIARAFPQLKCLVLDGAVKLTGESLTHIFERCHELEKVDLRVDPTSEKHPHALSENKDLKLYGKAGELRQLSLQGICLDTITVQSSLCGHSKLRELTLQACKVLCDDDFRLICQSSQLLESIKLIDCPSLTGRALASIARSNDAKVIDVTMIRCGVITSQQLKQFCQGVGDRIPKKLVLSQGKGLMASEYAKYAAVDPATQDQVYVLDREAMETLASSNNNDDSIVDGEHLISQRTYTLDRRQVALVAEQLGIPSQQLRAAISKVLSHSVSKKHAKANNDLSRPSSAAPAHIALRTSLTPHENENTVKPNVRISFKPNDPNHPAAAVPINESISSSPKPINDWAKSASDWTKPTSDLTKSAGDLTKTTGDLTKPTSDWIKATDSWPVASENRKYSPDIRKASVDTNNPIVDTTRPEPAASPVQSQPEDWADSSNNEDTQKIVFKYQPLRDRSKRTAKEETTENPTPRKEEKTSSTEPGELSPAAIQLGGWGVASSPTWGDSSPTFTESAGEWDASAVERMTWQPAQVVNAPVVKGAKKKGARLFLPATPSSEGWGAPPTEPVAWDDHRKQGFAHDIIENQHQTVFWKLENGVWKKLSSGEQKEQERQMQAATDADPKPKPVVATKDSPIQSAAVAHYILGNGFSSTENGTSTAASSQEAQPKDINQLSDDDEEADFSDSDDSVTIKTSADDVVPLPKQESVKSPAHANIMDDDLYMDYSDPSFSTAKPSDGLESPPSHPGNPQWVSFDLWKKTHQANCIDHPEASQNAGIAVDDGGWDDKPNASTEKTGAPTWGSPYDDHPAPEANPPIASYKLVDIIDSFNETMSTQSTHSRTTSDIKWEGFESSNGNDDIRYLHEPSPNKYEATVEYIKAQAESRQNSRNDVIRQAESDLISSSSSAFPSFESDECKYISNANSESMDSKNADDDWVSSSTSDAGYPVSGLGNSFNKVSRRSRNWEHRQRVSVRNQWKPEQMAGQWGSFPIDDVANDDNHTPNVSSLINVDIDESFANEREPDQMVKPMPNLTSAFHTRDEHERENALGFNLEDSFKTLPEQRNDPVTITNDLNVLDLKDDGNSMSTSTNNEAACAASSSQQPATSNGGTPPDNADKDFFDGLMEEASNAFSSTPLTANHETPINTEQDSLLTTASLSSQVTDSPGSNRIVLSVKIETVDSGTQPLVIMENDDPKAAIREFCNQYGMSEYESKIVDVTLPRYKEKMAKRLLGRVSRSSSNAKRNSMASPSLNSPTASMDSLL